MTDHRSTVRDPLLTEPTVAIGATGATGTAGATDPAGDPDWFREPTRREHWIGAALFGGFGIFFVLMFFVLLGWWFRWVILALGAISILRGASPAKRRSIDARTWRPTLNELEPPTDEPPTDEPPPSLPTETAYMDCGSGSRRNIVGFLSYALLFCAVCAVLVWMFVRFTGSFRLAIVLVVFMAGYMLVMGWFSSRGDSNSR